jgi:hypothetical protein
MVYLDALMGLGLVVVVSAAGVAVLHAILDRGDAAPGGRAPRALLALSLAGALVGNVDVLRIARALTLSPEARSIVARVAEAAAAPRPIPPPAMPLPEGTRPLPPPVAVPDGPAFNALAPLLPAAVFSGWDRDNLAELASAGLPVGWERTPLWVCHDAQGRRSVKLWEEPCGGGLAAGATLFLWLARALGLAMGAALIAPLAWRLRSALPGVRRR